ncbi:hypothetical protein BK704_07085 [[Bacillus thuringiensis] serovar konkukian]|nr:hypothetical protein [Bacillus thuringiensis]MED1299643.1 hypothetical protein [Bacillus pacificus]OUB15559.1 hypothetical protein BK704_07085 [[Bacillus thuringiensis] serovar konkukian]
MIQNKLTRYKPQGKIFILAQNSVYTTKHVVEGRAIANNFYDILSCIYQEYTYPYTAYGAMKMEGM